MQVKRHATSHGGVGLKGSRSSSTIANESKAALELHSKQSDSASPLITQVTGDLVKDITTATLIQRKMEEVSETLSESGISASLSETPMENSDGTSIDIHQLPSADIYTVSAITH